MSIEKLANVFGAMSLAVADEIIAATQKHAPRDDPSAGIALIGRSPGRSIRDVSQDLQLSHAATVRLVDRLCGDGLVRREKSSADCRAVALSLTQQGVLRYRAMLADRQTRLTDLLSELSMKEQAVLHTVSAKLLRRAAEDRAKRSKICRFCAVDVCTTCPMDSSADVNAT